MQRRKRGPRRRWGRAALPPRLAPELRGWLQEGILRRRSPAQLVADLVEATGMPVPAAERALERLVRDDLDRLDELGPLVRRAQQLELVLRLLREARRTGAQEPGTLAVPERAHLDPEAFFDEHYAPLLPVLLTEQIADWPALERWKLPALAERFPELEVEICDGREADPDYDMRFAEHRATLTMPALVDRILADPQSNDFYMVANNRNLEKDALTTLLEDVALPAFLDPERRDGWCSLWIGPGGTRTPLHHDLTSILFCQIVGRKRIHLVPPYELTPLAEARGVYAARDADARDAELHAEVELGPGQALFIPIGWWHQVEALTPSVSISFTNFRRSNRWGWYRPEKGHDEPRRRTQSVPAPNITPRATSPRSRPTRVPRHHAGRSLPPQGERSATDAPTAHERADGVRQPSDGGGGGPTASPSPAAAGHGRRGSASAAATDRTPAPPRAPAAAAASTGRATAHGRSATTGHGASGGATTPSPTADARPAQEAQGAAPAPAAPSAAATPKAAPPATPMARPHQVTAAV